MSDNGRARLVAVYEADCKECDFMRPLVAEIAQQNRGMVAELVELDAWEDAAEVRRLEVVMHPTVMLFIDGVERRRVEGVYTKRQILRRFLRYLYPNETEALQQLRTQLESPDERLPAGRPTARLGSNITEKVELLGNVSIFSGLNKRQLKNVARYADQVLVGGDSVIMEQGDPGADMRLICEGKVSVLSGKRTVGELVAGDVVGEMSLLDGEPRSATVRTDEDCVFLVLGSREFEYVLGRYPDVARAMLTTLSKRIRTLEE